MLSIDCTCWGPPQLTDPSPISLVLFCFLEEFPGSYSSEIPSPGPKVVPEKLRKAFFLSIPQIFRFLCCTRAIFGCCLFVELFAKMDFHRFSVISKEFQRFTVRKIIAGVFSLNSKSLKNMVGWCGVKVMPDYQSHLLDLTFDGCGYMVVKQELEGYKLWCQSVVHGFLDRRNASRKPSRLQLRASFGCLRFLQAMLIRICGLGLE